MRYGSTEEAAGQYLAGMLFDSDISVRREENGQKILIEPMFSDYKAYCLAEIGKPKITVFFLNETKDIDCKESFEL